MSDAVITKEKWDALSEKDRLMLKSMGINPVFSATKIKKEPPTKNPVTRMLKLQSRHTAPEEYYVKNHFYCSCCSTTEVVPGKMTRDSARVNHLHFIKQVIPDNEPWKARKFTRVTCPQCRVELAKHPVKDLIEKILQLVNINIMKEETQ